MTESKTTTTLRNAIDRSMSHDEIVRVEVEDQQAALQIIGELTAADIDWVRENDGSIDVWGWSEDTPEDEQDWRLRLVSAVECSL